MSRSAVLDRSRLDRAGVACLAVAVATSPWNAVSLGPVKIAHLALTMALAALVAGAARERRAPRLPWWVWLLGATIVLICVLSVWGPADSGYIAQRYSDGFPPLPVDAFSLRMASTAAGLKWIFAVVGLPLACCLSVTRRPERTQMLAAWWVVGVTVSAAVAITDQLAITRLAGTILTSVSFSGRQAGLSIHPNHLALSIALALPIAVWCVTRSTGWGRVWPAVAVVVMTGGLLITGSRAGMLGAAIGIPAVLLVDARTRRPAAVVGAVLVVGVAATVALRPGAWLALGQRFRFVNNNTADASDAIRAGLGRQALSDFEHSPVHGIGFEVLSQGHDIYLQLLANGGVILLVTFVVAQLGAVLEAWRVDDRATGIGRCLAVCIATFLIIGVAENQLADLFVQVPLALVAGLWAGAGTRPRWARSVLGRRTSGTSAREEQHVG